jgi:hypothetical protein
VKKLSLFLAFFLASFAEVQTAATVTLNFPAMPINRVRPGLLLTAKVVASGTVALDDGRTLLVVGDSIPATYVRGLGLRKTVDACVATAVVNGSGSMVISLPPEPVRMRRGVMVALAIDCPIVVVLADGKRFEGTGRFPDCPTSRVGFGSFLAAPVVFAGTAKLVGGK